MKEKDYKDYKRYKEMNNLRIGLMSAALIAGLASTNAQTVAADSVMQHVNGKRLSVGTGSGYLYFLSCS